MDSRPDKRRWARWLLRIGIGLVTLLIVSWLWVAPAWAEGWIKQKLADTGLTVRSLTLDTLWPSRVVARELEITPSARSADVGRLTIERLEIVPQRVHGTWSLALLHVVRPRLALRTTAPDLGWPLPPETPATNEPQAPRSPRAWLELLDQLGLDQVTITQGLVTVIDATSRREWSVDLQSSASSGRPTRNRDLLVQVQSTQDAVRLECKIGSPTAVGTRPAPEHQLEASLAIQWNHGDKVPLNCRATVEIDNASSWPADYRLHVPANDWRVPIGGGDVVGSGIEVRASWTEHRSLHLTTGGEMQWLAAGHVADGLRAQFQSVHHVERQPAATATDPTQWRITSELTDGQLESPGLGSLSDLAVQLQAEVRGLEDSSIKGSLQFARASPPASELRALDAKGAFHIVDGTRLALDRFRFRAGAGGVFTLRDAALHRSDQGMDLEVGVERLPLGTWFDLLGRNEVAGTGLLEGTLRLRLEWSPRLAIRLDRSHLVATGGGTLRIDDNEEVRRILTQQLGAVEAGGTQYDQVLQDRILGSLRNFAYRRLTFDVVPIDGPLGLRVQLEGTGRDVPQELNFGANFRNIQDAIDFALSMKLGFDRAKSTASDAVQPENR